MLFKILKSKLFKDYLRNVYGETYRFQFDKKIIYLKVSEIRYDPHDFTTWVLYYDTTKRGIFIIADQKFYPIEEFMEKLNKLKIFL